MNTHTFIELIKEDYLILDEFTYAKLNACESLINTYDRFYNTWIEEKTDESKSNLYEFENYMKASFSLFYKTMNVFNTMSEEQAINKYVEFLTYGRLKQIREL